MPSLPTSLIVLGLVAAWLVVLVPMVAKRREHVPDSDDDSVGFRVLRRASQSLRRRPVMSRTAIRDDGDGETSDAADDLDEDYVDEDYGDEDYGDEDYGDDGTEDAAADIGEPIAGSAGPAADASADGSVAGSADDRAGDARADRVGPVGRMGDEAGAGEGASAAERFGPGERVLRRGAGRPGDGPRAQPRRARTRTAEPRRAPAYRGDYGAEYDGEFDDARDLEYDRDVQYQREPEYQRDLEDDGRAGRDEADGDRHHRYGRRPAEPAGARGGRVDERRDEAGLRPVPVRPGRGGFDPRAAEQAKAYRYRQRRRVAVVLLAVAVVCAVVGVLGVSTAWVGAVCAFVLLALYLAYLRRQVRIEESIRQRRTARLERARQIRPVYRASVAEQVRAHRSGSLPRPGADDADQEAPYRVTSHAHPASSVPPAYYTRGVPVDLDDDDPAFDDLEYYRPAAYRRAVGE